ncbi:MAG TPA: hypothetical protein VIY72_11725, partial [Acidimicrobiales bacterium]
MRGKRSVGRRAPDGAGGDASSRRMEPAGPDEPARLEQVVRLFAEHTLDVVFRVELRPEPHA